MPKKPDTPCAGGCGKLLWSGSGSKPAGERKCRDCRKVQPKNRWTTEAKTAGRKGRPWLTLREQVLAEETRCFRCGEEVDKTLPPRQRWSPSVDHKVSIADGGEPLDRDNVALAHYGCNSSAGAYQRHDVVPPGPNGAVERELDGLRLGPRGRRLWREMKGDTLDPLRKVLLEEACRLADRMDRLDATLRGETAEWIRIQAGDDGEATVVVDRLLAEARQHAGAFAQVVGKLRQAAGEKSTTGGSVLDQLAAKRAQRRADATG